MVKLQAIKVKVSRRRLIMNPKVHGDYRSESWVNCNVGAIPTFEFVFYIENGKLYAELRDARDGTTLDEASGEEALLYLYDALTAYDIPIQTDD
ncbi:MAG: hypothetical protein QXZ14_11185 [Candidatus Jordarchaeales archaeon]